MDQSYTITTMVTDTMTAQYVKSGDLAVLATPVMIALMEQAAAQCLITLLEPTQTSVGTEINVRHVAATPVTATIKVQAVMTARDDRKASFALQAFDEAGLIGEGTHTRVIVDRERFIKKANEKQPKQ